ncbi:MAG: sulfur carrier protein ThiS [Bacillota bacterium]
MNGLTITLNGKKAEFDDGISLIELLSIKGLEPERVVVEYNFQVLKREEWDKVILKENDTLEVLRFVGGG